MKQRWTLERFVAEAIARHENRYDYSHLTPLDIKTTRTKFSLLCTVCNSEFRIDINHHIHQCGRCPSRVCTGHKRWEFDEFVTAARRVHGNRFQYAPIDNKGPGESKTRITCTCGHTWITTMSHHVRGKRACRNCYGCEPWTYEKFMLRAREIHKNSDYDYSRVEPRHIKNVRSHVPLTCRNCGTEWTPSVDSYILHSSGCPGCMQSKGELRVMEYLQQKNIAFQPQFRDQRRFNHYTYDFEFKWANRACLMEYDGAQHFEITYYTPTENKLAQRQKRDIEKSLLARQHKYFLIRVDDKADIVDHMDNALKACAQESLSYYFSSPARYQYILSNLEDIDGSVSVPHKRQKTKHERE